MAALAPTLSRRGLRGHRKGLSDADVALVRETARGGSANTEVLSYVEGFMTAFHLIDPPPPASHPIFLELLGALDTTRVLPWRSADASVRDLAVARLERYCCETLDDGHRRASDAWATAQAQRVKDDDAALAAHSDSAAVATAHDHQQNSFADLVKRLAAIPGRCRAGAQRAR